jgi:hypothetical protein
VNFNDLRLAGKGERICRFLRTHGSQWGRRWLELLRPDPVDGYEIYMRRPGERVPPPPRPGRRWDVRPEEWVLAA